MKTTFLAPIVERYRLNPASEKETYHLIIDLRDTPVQYQVGDCLCIYPSNESEQVEKIITTLKATGSEKVKDREAQEHPLRDFLINHANLGRIPLQFRPAADWEEVIHKHNLTPQQFIDHLSPLLPRFYSIASSMEKVGKEAHLTVQRTGLCSTFLCHRAPLHQPVIRFYHQKTLHFTLHPETHTKPLIMIGPGTGIAPFRGFLQEREVQKKSMQNWLFFGEWNRASDFYYENELQALVGKKILQLELAFSRDQAEKEYVQDKMLAQGANLWQWLEAGAFLYVCGDAKSMARDVDKALHAIIQQHGEMSESHARDYIKKLKCDKRYLRDVY